MRVPAKDVAERLKGSNPLVSAVEEDVVYFLLVVILIIVLLRLLGLA